MTVPNFMSKAGSYQDLGREVLYTPPGTLLHKNVPGQPGLK